MLRLLFATLSLLSISCSEKDISDHTVEADVDEEVEKVPHTALKAGDTINLSIKGAPLEQIRKITGIYVINHNGSLNLAYIKQPIDTNGLSCVQLEDKIENLYKSKQIYNFPEITISKFEEREIVDRIAKQLYVSGDLPYSGSQKYKLGLTAIKAFEEAGLELDGKPHEFILIRNGKTYEYDLSNELHANIRLYPRDQITLKRRK